MRRRADAHKRGFQRRNVRRAVFQPDSPFDAHIQQPAWQQDTGQDTGVWQAHGDAQHLQEDPWAADFTQAHPDWLWEGSQEAAPAYEAVQSEPYFSYGQAQQPGQLSQEDQAAMPEQYFAYGQPQQHSPYEEAAYGPDPYYLDPNQAGSRPDIKAPAKPRRFPFVSLGVLVLSLVIISACLINIKNAQSGQAAFQQKLQAMATSSFFDNIEIDGMPVGGMTPAQLRQMDDQQRGSGDPGLNIQLHIDNTIYQLDSSYIPYQRNLEEVMEAAWAIGRQNTGAIVNSQWTPFEARYRQMEHARRNGASFHTAVSFSGRQIDALAEGLAQRTNTEPVNAVVSSFDFQTQQFSVTQDVTGRRIEAANIATALKNALNAKNYQAEIRLESTPVLPMVTSSDLRNRFTRLATFSTKTTSNEDRNNNIALAAQAISNTTLMPGETFSFNETTGQRTIEKGYRGAPAIYGGMLIDDVGGGVCQVSSTLFNAAAQAGMSIVDRSPHAWPVSYLDRGLDAAVNWPNLDFKFKNDQLTPVFIIAHYQKRTLTIEFYGLMNGPGESIALETQLISTTPPPKEPAFQQNVNLPAGTQKELKKARTGYVVDTYRVYLRDGREYRREKLFTSKYRMVQQLIEFN